MLMGHRFYDSRIGRFISQDPAKSGNNWYAYAGNNPVNKTDPLGLTPMDGPGSSPVGSPGYGGVADGMGYAENFASEEDARDDYNQQVDQVRSAYFAAQTEEVNWVFNVVGPSGSISLGPIHIDGGLGIAIQGPGLGATGWGLETFGSVNVGLGIGLGVSVSTGKIANLGSIGFGVGNLNGFNGGSWFGGLYAQPFMSLAYSQSLTGGYKGVQVGLPGGGLEAGLYGGLGYTQPIFSKGSKN